MEILHIETPDGVAQAWVVRPPDAQPNQPLPAVLFCMDLNGLRPQTQHMIERIASWGYVVVAPNTLYRSGDIDAVRLNRDLLVPGEREKWQAEAMPRLAPLTRDAVQRDVRAYVAAAVAAGGGGPIGVTGYCMGARIALIAACTVPDSVVAVGGWHGAALATDQPDSAHLLIDTNVRAAFAWGHAHDDALNPAEAIARVDEAMNAAGIINDSAVFPGPHAYTMADTLMYREEADVMHWVSLESLLAEHLPN